MLARMRQLSGLRRMSTLSELLAVFLAAGRQLRAPSAAALRLLCEPGFDRGNMRVELGWHANSGLIRPTNSVVRRGPTTQAAPTSADQASEIACLRQENERLRMELEI
ncbi:hypothetical protein N2605_27330 [Bradyrhizobium yuanmingense]|uniref:hypothetical protein n=1 Tax=Bradyrhizobium yuanmingense TaxID=108015 RepID=UPI0021A7F83A|nr:hypothetical protein [Bradyrhizobium sp. CB1024]UWU83219.1 hypothetical protein N2605_27330 [Bradyrhizobium sp. CB1024]